MTRFDRDGLEFESYYSAELMPDRAVAMVTKILSIGLPDAPPQPPAADLGNATAHG